MRFDPTITLGVLLHAAVIIASIIVGFTRFARRMEKRIDQVYAELDKRIGNGAVPLGQRLALMEQKLDQMWDWFTTRMERRS